MVFDKKEDFIKYLDIAVSLCEKDKCIDTEEVLYETHGIEEYNKNSEVKYTPDILEYTVDTIRYILAKKGYYIRPQTKLDWELMSFGTVFFTYKGKEMWITTLVGQGSEDMIGFNHPGLSDEFELWSKTNPAKKYNLFPELESAINEYYDKKEESSIYGR